MGYPAREALEMSLGKETGAALYRQIVERVGKKPGKELGHGTKGVVYDLGDGRVLKLTADASELEAMTLMKQSDHPNLVRVEDVFVVCRGQSGVGVVVREWVGSVLERLDLPRGFFDSLSMALDHTQDSMDLNNASLAGGMEDLLIYLDDVGESLEEDKIIEGLQAGIQELMRLGVHGVDFHSKNIAVDNAGEAVIFDVGIVDLKDFVPVDRVSCQAGKRIVSFSAD